MKLSFVKFIKNKKRKKGKKKRLGKKLSSKNLGLILSQKKWLREATAVALLILLIVSAIFYQPQPGYAAAYSFTQTSWSGGISSTSTAEHPTNQSSWALYSSSANINVVNSG